MAVIGFINTVISVLEDSGHFIFDIGVLQGSLRINVDVEFTTVEGTAQGMISNFIVNIVVDRLFHIYIKINSTKYSIWQVLHMTALLLFYIYS